MASSNKSTEMTVRVGVEQVNAAVRSLEELERRIRSILGTTGGSSGGGVPNVGEQFGQRIPSAISDTKASTMSPLPMFGGGGSGGVGGSPASVVIHSVTTVVINAASSVMIGGSTMGSGGGGTPAGAGGGTPSAPTGSQQAQQGGGGGTTPPVPPAPPSGGGSPQPNPPNNSGMGGFIGQVMPAVRPIINAYNNLNPQMQTAAKAGAAVFIADQAVNFSFAAPIHAATGIVTNMASGITTAATGTGNPDAGVTTAHWSRQSPVFDVLKKIPVFGGFADGAQSLGSGLSAIEQATNRIARTKVNAEGARTGMGSQIEKWGNKALGDTDYMPQFERTMELFNPYGGYGFFDPNDAYKSSKTAAGYQRKSNLYGQYSQIRGDIEGGAAAKWLGEGNLGDVSRRSRVSDVLEGNFEWMADGRNFTGWGDDQKKNIRGLATQVSELQRTSTMGGYAASIGQSQLSGLTAFGATPQEKIAALQSMNVGMTQSMGAKEKLLGLAEASGADKTQIERLRMELEMLRAAIKENVRSQNDLISATRSSIASSHMSSAQAKLQRGLISEGAYSGAWGEYGASASEARSAAEAYLARPDIQRDPAQRAQAQAAVDQAKYQEWDATVRQPALAKSAENTSYYSLATAGAQATAMTAGFYGGIEGGLEANLQASSAARAEAAYEMGQANDLRARGLISPAEANARIASSKMKTASADSAQIGALTGAAGAKIGLSGNIAQSAGARFGAYTTLTGSANTIGLGRESMSAQFGYAGKFGEQADWLKSQGAHSDITAAMYAQGEQAYAGALTQAGSFQFAPSTGIRSGMAQNQLSLQAVTSLNSVQGSARPLLENQMGLLKDALSEMTETFKGKKSAIMSQPIDPSGKGGGFRSEADRKAALESLSAGFAESKSQLGGQMISAQAQLEQGMLDKVLSAQYGQSSMSPLLMSQFSKRESGLFSDVWSQYFGGNQKSIASARGRGSQLVGSFFGNTETQAGIEDTIAGGVAGKNINLGGEVTFRIQLEDLNGNKMYDNKHVVNASQMTPSKQVGPTQR